MRVCVAAQSTSPASAVMPSPLARAAITAFSSIMALVRLFTIYVPTEPETPTAPPAPVITIPSISVSSVACTRILSLAKRFDRKPIRASVTLFAAITPAAPVTPTRPPLIERAICIMSARPLASTAMSPPDLTVASSSI